MNIVLMAGGGGTRLWPLSRGNKPKQFLDLGTGKTLLEHTWDRARAVTDVDHIYVATTAQYIAQVRHILPAVTADRISIETERRDTGPAIAAVAARLQADGQGDEPIMFMWSDHYFTAEDAFIADLKRLDALVKVYPDHIVLVGHRPTAPETTLGYIELGESISPHVYRVAAFKEKPNTEKATEYVAAGNYVWNMAYISCTPNYLLQQLAEHSPKLLAGITRFTTAVDEAAQAQAYQALPSIAIDYALLEKTPRLLAVVGDYGWSDVGSWGSVQEVFGKHGDHVPFGHHVHVDSHNNYIYNVTDRAVTMLGMRNTIVVVTDDAVLVTDKAEAHRVKEIIAKLEENHRHDLL
jgi:mannose-1-phosphate guanylyltransferase